MYDHFALPSDPTVTPWATALDVTLRDGGFEVDFHWPDDVYHQVPAALAPLGVEIVELGYLGGVPLDHGVGHPGAGAFLTPDHVHAARRDELKLAAMVHPSALQAPLDLARYVEAGLDMLRLVFHPSWFTGIQAAAEHARSVGLTTTVNIALASRYDPDELCQHAEKIQKDIGPDILYLADTCGAMRPEQVADLVGRLHCGLDAEIGFHAHDFLSLAYANALAAVQVGATYIDCSTLGLGRGGGNLTTELVLTCHRLPGHLVPDALTPLLTCRSRLADITGRPTPSVVPAVCGALNLTPVEEAALRQFAAEEDLDLEHAALWLLTAHTRVSSLRTIDLRAAWQAQNTEPRPLRPEPQGADR